MKRSSFFLVTTIIAFVFGLMMLFAPLKAVEGFGMVPTFEAGLIFRTLGVTILSTGVLNFLVRDQPDSPALKAVLIFNVVLHGLGMAVDLLGVFQGIIDFTKIIPGLLAHLFIGIGSLLYVARMNRAHIKTDTSSQA